LSERQQVRRTSFVSKPNFQLKLTIIFMLMVTIVANLVGGICYLFISEKVAALLAQNPEIFAGVEMADVARFLIPKILLAEAISLCIVFILSILITHTIAGPVYRMEQTAKEIGEGNLALVTRLRPRDEFKELADALNQMAFLLSKRIRQIRFAVEEVEAAGDRDFSTIYKAFDGLRLAGETPPEKAPIQE
jgi:methyl-accepting chemotaxis protein